MKDIKDTTLWKTFASKADEKQQAVVAEFIRKAADRLMLVRDTFPTYTLHNESHSLNLIDLIEKLLGSKIENASALELAILMLSAYYHDIGMVFSHDERNNLQEEIYFKQFIEEHPGALLKLRKYQNAAEENKNALPDDVAEWYCRWIHPQRSEDHIKAMGEILWNGFPLNDAVALVCKSHGFAVSEVSKWENLETDFCGSADLLFCSILLRLADILDFDNSRSPEEIYEYLGLSERKSRREKNSDIEWKKHLCSTGFVFPSHTRDERYAIKFIAAPTDPAVEYDVRQFLDVIETEIEKCASVLKYCSPKWHDIKLPLAIDRKDVKSKGYAYGNYRFTLEQEQIMDLLMGENLYSDKYAFIRELVQNAIDTTRLRVIYEKSTGNTAFEPEPIRISYWTDKDGYTWLRIDDYGMGMDEEIITGFFLKVGNSYYRSERFQVEMLNYKTDFMPISRFGIGVLSCFIVGDSMELNTRKVTSRSEHNALRMSLKGLNNFYILKKEKEKHAPLAMPGEADSQEKYRKPGEFGTSIAVRLDPRKETGSFHLESVLNKYIVCSPVPVTYNGARVGGNYNDLIANKWLEPFEIPVSKNIQSQIEDTLKMKFSGELTIEINPLDLSVHSPSENLKGQAIYGLIRIPEKDSIFFQDEIEQRNLKIKWGKLNKDINLIAAYEDTVKARKFERIEWDMKAQDSLIRNKIENLSEDFSNKYVERACRRLINIIDVEDKSGEYSGKEMFFIKSPRELLIQVLEIKKKIEQEKDVDPERIEILSREIDEFSGSEQLGSKFRKIARALQRKDPRKWPDFEKSMRKLIGTYPAHLHAKLELLIKEVDDFLKQKSEYKEAVRIFETALPELTEEIRERVPQLKYHWISHNGIFVPVECKEFVFEINNPLFDGFIRYNIALKDALRPDLSLSRDELKGIPWQVYSDISLMFARAFKNIPNNDGDIFTELIGCENFSYGRLLEDKNIKSDDGWYNEIRIVTDKGKLTAKQIKEGINSGNTYVIKGIADISSIYGSDIWNKPSFLDICKMMIIQKHLPVQYLVEEKQLIALNDSGWAVVEALDYYPPLFFVPYDTDHVLRIGNNPVNANHRFAKWLLNNTVALAKNHPSLFENIKRNLAVDLIRWDNVNRMKIIQNLNRIIQRLRDIKFEDKPEKELSLTEKDFMLRNIWRK
ncbi:MAG: hypothetical protein PUB21_07110 [Bacteroidales bacterium]|nr:hypothetical protein [Bacteroidales bacterium]